MKVYIITGAASGIGLRIAQDLLNAHARVVVVDVKPIPDELKDVERKQNLIYVQGSSSEESIAKETIKLLKPWGRLDGLINNTGIMIRKPLTALSLDEWNKVIHSNLTSAFLFSKESAPLLKSNGGSIINIASTRAHQSEPDTESYAATKGALLSLTHALSISLGPEIRVNCISPGWIDSRTPEKQAKDPLKASDHQQHPVGRVGRVEDISQFVLYLISSHAGFITGQEFVIDGGMTKKMIYRD